MVNAPARLVVVSCPKRQSLQAIWRNCFAAAWPDCPLPVTILSPEEDIGWNYNLIRCLEQVEEEFILLMLDDNFLEPSPDYTANVNAVLDLMTRHTDIALVKLQAGGAWPPEVFFPEWPRIQEYDRRPHPFKRTNLIPAMYRRSWLIRLCKAVLDYCGPDRDKARHGAIEFEIAGTLLTENSDSWPERMFGIHRPNKDGGGGQSLLHCYANDAVTAGKIRENLRYLCEGIPGAEVWL